MIYSLFLAYLFVGVAIAADLFMGGVIVEQLQGWGRGWRGVCGGEHTDDATAWLGVYGATSGRRNKEATVNSPSCLLPFTLAMHAHRYPCPAPPARVLCAHGAENHIHDEEGEAQEPARRHCDS